MATRGESNNAWFYSGSASTWQGRSLQSQGRAIGQDDAAWRGWQASPASSAPSAGSADFNLRGAQHDEFESSQVSSTFSAYPPQESESNTLCMSNLEAWMDHERWDLGTIGV